MNNIYLILRLQLLLILTIPLNAQDFEGIDLDLEDLICKEREHAEDLLHYDSRTNAFAHQTDMHYQVMRWEINPATYYIKGHIDYYFKSNVENLNNLILDFTDLLNIDSITRNGDVLSYTHDADHLLTIHLDKNLDAGEFDTLTISYQGMPPSNGFGSFEQGTHAGADIIWTLSEPYGARDWWPAKQDLIDKIDSVDIYITTPPGQLAASNGKLISISETDGKMVHHWRHRYPIVNYLIALAVTNYASYSQYVPLPNGDSIEMLNYVYPESLTSTQQATLSSIDIMQLYNELFGLYPFAAEKYGHAQFGWGGGEEHQTMSFMGTFSFSLQAHEMAHQWFGNKVTCGSWTDIWLNEGFATYLTGLTYERFSPDQFWISWKNSTSNAATSAPGGSVFVDDTTDVGRIFSGRLSYNKGAYLLHMMRWIAGDSAFFQACREYLNGAGTAYDFGRTVELKNHFENVSGKDFGEFLADWFYGEGYPSYDLRWVQQADSLIVWLGQRQSHPSVSFFQMPVPILVVANGDSTIYRVEHSINDQRFSFYTGDMHVDSVGFDPDKWILSRNNTVTEISTSSGDISEEDPYTVFPNPASDFIDIVPSANIKRITAIDITGVSTILSSMAGQYDVSKFTPGIYTLLLESDKENVVGVKRLIIHR